ncbi:MAG: DUF1127 domain-containing protein [Amaricoccus sp.]|uniref:DUF1127 domain-containing protein n=1 Tax=Amaricoccus sp. TaxID=1872485 RepID=UPI0039E6084E
MANVVHAEFGRARPGLLSRLSGAIADYRLYRRTLSELESLSNRDLRDLGISRYSTRQIAYDAVYGR